MADNVTLNLSEDYYQGDAILAISVDGGPATNVTVTAKHGTATQPYTLNLAAGAHTISAQLTNDLYGGSASEDRNGYVESIYINGTDQNLSIACMAGDVHTVNVTVPATVSTTDLLNSLTTLQADLDAYKGTSAAALAALQTDIDASFAKVLAAIAAIPSTGGGSAPATPAAPLNTTFPAGWTTLTVSPTDSLQAALAAAAKGFVLTLSPGTYKQVQNVPAGLDGWTIKSTTGKPGDVTVDGGGGLTVAANNVATASTPGRLSQGKGVFHLSSPGTIQGITVTGGGLAAAGNHDGQAGVYWECSNGTCATIDCIITGNQNGVFGNSSNVGVTYVHTDCLFSNNGTDGGSHDTYVEGDSASSQIVTRCIANGSNAGNNFKSRLGTVTLTDSFIGSINANRWYDCADGAVLSVNGCTLVGNDGGENVAANGDETITKGPGNTTWSTNTVYVGNRQQDICNAGTFAANGCVVNFTGSSSQLVNSKGTGTGTLPTSPSGTYAPYPAVPAYPLAA